MSDLQTMQADQGNVDPSQMANTPDEMANGGEEEKTRRTRRKLRPAEVSSIRRFKELAEVGDSISYTTLAPELKRIALGIPKDIRLIEKGILLREFDENDGRILSVSLDEESIEALKDEIAVRPVEPRQPIQRRGMNNILSDAKYHIHKLKEPNPRRSGTHAWYNYEYCYKDGMSVVEYMDFMDYPRDIVVESRGGKNWFNGPSSTYLLQDIRSGYVAIYDASLSESDEGYWLKPEDVFAESTAKDEDEAA